MFKTTLLMNNGQMVKWSQNGQIYFKNPAANAASVFGHFGTLLMREFMKALDWPNLFERNGGIGTKRFNSFHVNVPFLYPLKTPENRRFSDIFRGIEMRHWRENGYCNSRHCFLYITIKSIRKPVVWSELQQLMHSKILKTTTYRRLVVIIF